MATTLSERCSEIAPGASEYAPYYATYIRLVPPGDVLEFLDRQIGEVSKWLGQVPAEQQAVHHAPYTWTLKEVVGHLDDAERIMAYRALRIARGDATPLPGFDENAYVPAGEFNRRPWADLIEGYVAVRRCTVGFFRGLRPEAWTRMGTANNVPVSVRALAHIIAGHTLHHFRIMLRRLAG
jgi:hypothetical protein